MTLEEKIGQMCEITIDVVTDFEASKEAWLYNERSYARYGHREI